MFKQYIELFKDLKTERRKHKKNSLLKKLVFLAIFLLLMFAGVRAYSLNSYYNASIEQDKKITNTIETTNKEVLTEFLTTSYLNAYYHNLSTAYDLQSNLIEEHGIDKVYESLVDGKYDEDVYKTFINTFSKLYHADESQKDSMIIVADDNGVIYLRSNNKLNKYVDMKQENNTELIEWKEFISLMGNREGYIDAFNKAYFKSYTSDPVIIRMDGEFKNGKECYTIDDLCEIYEKEGIEGLDGYGFLVMATITEKGDMYGNIDTNFMNGNEVHKLYVYQYVDVTTFLEEHDATLKDLDDTTLSIVGTLQQERKIDMLISVFSLFFILVVIICLMIVFRELDNIDDLEQITQEINNEEKE